MTPDIEQLCREAIEDDRKAALQAEAAEVDRPLVQCPNSDQDAARVARFRGPMKEHLHTKTDPRIFVFGSNLKGIHGAGAAAYAARELGAERGVGEGRTGRAYALPTCRVPGEPLHTDNVRLHVLCFLAHAALAMDSEPDTRFFVSAVGCGIAGFTEDEVAPLFANAPANCDLPPGWHALGRKT